jgi:phage terminase large subunit
LNTAIIKLKAAEEIERRKREEQKLKQIVGGGYDEFWEDKHRYRVVKGGRGSKKSTTTALWFIWNIMKYPLSNAVVVRKTGNTHKDSTFAQLKWAAIKLGVYDKWDFKVSPLEAVYKPTGQKILFRGFDDPLKTTSMTVEIGVLCWAWFEEVFEIDEEKDFDTFDEAIRGEMPQGLWKQLTLTYNPWIDSHWTKTRFWDGECPSDTFRDTTTHQCNEFLDQADHDKIEALQQTNPDRYKVVGLGEYGLPGGTYFEEFRRDIHVIEPHVIPEDYKRYRVFDYGLDMLACYWIAVDYQGRAEVYKELYESGHIISSASKRIIEVNGKDEIYDTLAPPDMRNTQKDTGKSMLEIYGDNGISLSIASNNRITGWMNLKEWLAPYETLDEFTGEPIKTANLKIWSNCHNLIRCISSITKDEKDPNDCATEPHELTHAPDALRYWTAGRPCPTYLKPDTKDKKLIEKMGWNKQTGSIKTFGR